MCQQEALHIRIRGGETRLEVGHTAQDARCYKSCVSCTIGRKGGCWLLAQDPYTAQKCIELAAKLYCKRQMAEAAAGVAAPLRQAMMGAGGAAFSSLADRLARLEELKKQGMVTEEVRSSLAG